MKGLNILVVGGVALSLAACEGTGPKQRAGTLLGAVAGAVAGAQVGKGKGRLVGTAVGTLLGALAGSEIGKSLDRADMAYLRQTQQRALEKSRSGETSSWVNPDSGNSGGVTPQRTYKNTSGAYCREFQQTITVGGKTEQAYGTACRQPDGSWKIVSETSEAPRQRRMTEHFHYEAPRGLVVKRYYHPSPLLAYPSPLLAYPSPLLADVFLFSVGCFQPWCGYRPWIVPSRKWRARRHVYERHKRKVMRAPRLRPDRGRGRGKN